MAGIMALQVLYLQGGWIHTSSVCCAISCANFLSFKLKLLCVPTGVSPVQKFLYIGAGAKPSQVSQGEVVPAGSPMYVRYSLFLNMQVLPLVAR